MLDPGFAVCTSKAIMIKVVIQLYINELNRWGHRFLKFYINL